MKPKIHIPVLVAFTFGAVVLLSIVSGATEYKLTLIQLKLTQVLTGFGGLVALLSALMLLGRAAAGHPLTELVPLTLPLLAGVLIVSFHWIAALMLGVVAVACVVRDVLGSPAERRGAEPPPVN